MTNISFKEHPFTTVVGTIFLILGTVLFVLPYFFELREEPEWYVPTGFLIGGLGLIGAPDSIFDGISNLVKRKSEQI